MSSSTQSFTSALSFPEEHDTPIPANPLVLAERRQKYRYPLSLNVRFRYFSAGCRFSGVGLATNLGSGGILVSSKHQIVVGALVEMSID